VVVRRDAAPKIISQLELERFAKGEDTDERRLVMEKEE